jgi:excisionase family DNA binding protein
VSIPSAANFATPALALSRPCWPTLALDGVSRRAEPSMTAENQKNVPHKPFLTTKEAAAWLGLTKNTLEKMRVHGDGPLYRKHGRYVRYHLEDLIAWSEANKRRSTSDVR